jgi:choline-sulfatase
MHFRSVEDDNGFPDERLIMDVKGGVGDLFGIARQSMPPQGHMVENVRNAGAGETEYTRFDTAVAGEAVNWIESEAGRSGEPWCLWVSLVTPHFPYVAPQEYFDLYPLDEVEWPINGSVSDWPDHPVMENMRRLGMPIPGGEFDEETVRRAIAAYYGLVTFTDRQIGRVLEALQGAGLTDSTRIMYTSDHGEMLGDFGKWGKSCMYEGSAAVPLVAAGPGIPEGKVVEEPVSLVDCYPAILEAVGATREATDDDLPGTSLWDLADGNGRARDEPVFSEYHAIYSPDAQYMLRDSRYKYVYYAGGYPPQLFDMRNDPLEERDLGRDPNFGDVVAKFESQLCEILDPDAVDRLAKADQKARLDAHGGAEKILGEGLKINFSPAPAEFQ